MADATTNDVAGSFDLSATKTALNSSSTSVRIAHATTLAEKIQSEGKVYLRGGRDSL